MGHVIATTKEYATRASSVPQNPAPVSTAGARADASLPFDSETDFDSATGFAVSVPVGASVGAGVGAAPVEPATTRHAAART